jgi:hypothetical protein
VAGVSFGSLPVLARAVARRVVKMRNFMMLRMPCGLLVVLMNWCLLCMRLGVVEGGKEMERAEGIYIVLL